MFRVDPAFKFLPVAALRGVVAEDYEFVQLTRNCPIWLLQVLIARSETEAHRRSNYMFIDLRQAVEIASCPTWAGRVLSVLLPDHISNSNRAVTSVVTEIWEGKTSRGNYCYEVSTEEGVYVLDSGGTPYRKAKRTNLLFLSKS